MPLSLTVTPSSQYSIANQRFAAHVVSLPMIWETPLRTGNLRDPNGPQVTFAFESFIDELAAAAQADPVRFRLEYQKVFPNCPLHIPILQLPHHQHKSYHPYHQAEKSLKVFLHPQLRFHLYTQNLS